MASPPDSGMVLTSSLQFLQKIEVESGGLVKDVCSPSYLLFAHIAMPPNDKDREARMDPLEFRWICQSPSG